MRKINYTEESIKKESVDVLLTLLKDYAVQKRDDWRNGAAYQADIDQIEAEIKRRLIRYQERVAFLQGTDIKDYEKRGYAASCEVYHEDHLTRDQAEESLQRSLEYCEAQGYLVLESGIIEVQG